MINIKSLIERRKIFRSKKPDFVRPDANIKIFKKKWRKPKGIHNKMREHKKGHGKQPRIGYGAPSEIKNLNLLGLRDILVFNVSDLNNINKNTESALISSTVGLKKKFEIVKKAKEINIIISNLKNTEEFLKKTEEFILKKKQDKLKTKEVKEKSKEEALRKAEEKEKIEKEKPKEEKSEEKIEQELLKKEHIGKIEKTAPREERKLGKTPMQRLIPAGEQK